MSLQIHMHLRLQNMLRKMKGMIFILSMVIIRIECYGIRESRKQIKPKTSEIQNIITATTKISNINEEMNTILDRDLKNVSIRTIKVDDFLPYFQSNIDLLKNVFDKVIHDYVVENLWNYCQIVYSVIAKISETRNFEKKDVDLFKFEESFDYSIVTYLFNSNIIARYVHQILDIIYYLQTLPYIRFSTASQMQSIILEKMTYMEKTFKLYNNYFPGYNKRKKDHKLSSINELTDRLRNIQSDISQVFKGFRFTTAPPIINKNFVLNRKILDSTSKFVKSVMNNESFNVKYSIFTKNIVTPQHIIVNWFIDATTFSLAQQFSAYKTSVTSSECHLYTSVTYNEDPSITTFVLKPKDTNTIILKDNLNTLSLSLGIHDDYNRHCYCNAMNYHNIVVDIFMFVSTKLGFRMLSGMRTVFDDACAYQLQKKRTRITLTLDMIYLMRSQLLQFQFYYKKMNELIHHRLDKVVDYSDIRDVSYTTFQEVLPSILSLINITSSVEEFLRNNCDIIINKLGKNEGFYGTFFDEFNFKLFYFVDTTRYMYEIFDYYALHINIT